jgi:hypothetical protein
MPGMPGRILASSVPLLVAALGLAPPAARAAPQQPQPKPRVLPVAVTLTDNARAYTGRVQTAIEAALRKGARHDAQDPVERFDPGAIGDRRKAAERAAELLAAGRKAYEGLEDGMGLEQFGKAVEACEQSALWETFPTLTRALAMKTLIRWNEDPAMAKRELPALLALDPKLEFPPEFVSPDLAAEFQRQREALKSEKAFPLDIATEPVAARVYVDGVYRDTSPLTVRGLPSGEHYVTLVAPGYEVSSQKVVARAGASATIRLKPLEKARPYLTFMERITKGFGEPDEVNAATVLGRSTGSEEVLVAGVRRQGGRVTVLLHRIVAKDGHVAAVLELDVAEKDDAFGARVEQFAARALATDRERGSGNAPLGIRTGLGKVVSEVGKISEDSVKLGLGITGLALVTTGAILGGVAYSREEELRKTPQTTPGVQDKADGVFSMSVASDVLVGTGLLAGGVWAWLQFGKLAAKKREIEAPPVLEQKKDEPPGAEPEKKKKADEDDPFAADMEREERPALGTLDALFAPLTGGAYVGLRGEF